ncbi:MAG: hypothetical protein NXH91_13085 [Phyllobacteriaceae bacterium]|jgi:hypothetical protein|nr:hypothetical protein [Phyllobacteriaceae bacterium]
MSAYPHGLAVRTPAWLSERCNIKRHAIETHYRDRGLLDGAGNDAAVQEPASDADTGVRSSEPADPLLSAPLTDVAGGTIYFAGASVDRLGDVLEIMGVRSSRRDFLAIASQSRRPTQSRYLDQLWLISALAGRSVFGLDGEEHRHEQSLTLEQAVTGFVERQVGKWTEPAETFSRQLDGMLGGDGEYAREALGFGFHVEDGFHGVYRVWSRPWIVLK